VPDERRRALLAAGRQRSARRDVVRGEHLGDQRSRRDRVVPRLVEPLARVGDSLFAGREVVAGDEALVDEGREARERAALERSSGRAGGPSEAAAAAASPAMAARARTLSPARPLGGTGPRYVVFLTSQNVANYAQDSAQP